MVLKLTGLAELSSLAFDTVIDVRSPAEYAEDHLPGAINLPVLDDEERARIGTIYKQQSPFLARKLGAALVARNAARHLEGALADKGGGWRPLVYCWRGGQRSGSFATILSQVGWRVELLEGGYKSWRHLVVDALTVAPPPPNLWVLDGNTGTAKTELLLGMAALGHQVIDLEGLANHRGSLFGHMPGGQPGQKAFDGRLATLMAALDPARPVLIEAESSRVGALMVPKQLWAAMGAAPRLHIAAPLMARARYLGQAYADLTTERTRLSAIIESLRPLHPAERIDGWQAAAAAGDFVELAAGLMRDHYDWRYEKHRARYGSSQDITLQTDDLDAAALQDLTLRLAKAIG